MLTITDIDFQFLDESERPHNCLKLMYMTVTTQDGNTR